MVAASLVEAVWIAAYDVPRLRRIVQVGRPDFSPKPLARLFLACLPLLVSSFLAAYLGNVCKYAIEAAGTEQMQTVFNVLFMPSFVINLFMIFLMRPTLTRLAKLWLGHEARPFSAHHRQAAACGGRHHRGGRRRVRGRRHPRAGAAVRHRPGRLPDAAARRAAGRRVPVGLERVLQRHGGHPHPERRGRRVRGRHRGGHPRVGAAGGGCGRDRRQRRLCAVLPGAGRAVRRSVRLWRHASHQGLGRRRAQAAGHGRNARRRRRAHRRKTFPRTLLRPPRPKRKSRPKPDGNSWRHAALC